MVAAVVVTWSLRLLGLGSPPLWSILVNEEFVLNNYLPVILAALLLSKLSMNQAVVHMTSFAVEVSHSWIDLKVEDRSTCLVSSGETGRDHSRNNISPHATFIGNEIGFHPIMQEVFQLGGGPVPIYCSIDEKLDSLALLQRGQVALIFVMLKVKFRKYSIFPKVWHKFQFCDVFRQDIFLRHHP